MNNAIWAPKPFMSSQICVKIMHRGYEISIALDDSAGAADSYVRTMLCIFDINDNIVTHEFCDHRELYSVTSLDLQKVLEAIDRKKGYGWQEWHGVRTGPNLPDDTQIEVIMRDGWQEQMRKDEFSWSHSGDRSDIIRYRIVE